MNQTNKTRRSFVRDLTATASMLTAGCNAGARSTKDPRGDWPGAPADITLRIGTVIVEIAKNHAISTIGYNGSVPGPLIRLRESSPVTVEILNDTDTPELVHWHGLIVPTDVDGAEEEQSLVTPPHGGLRYRLTPQPSGARYVHTHVMSMSDLSRGAFTGQFGFVYIEPKNNPGQYDQEIFLATHEWEPYFTAMEEEEEAGEQESHEEPHHGWEVRYRRSTINGKCLGYGEPVRVKEGQRVLFHLLNASATENIRLALPGHHFEVVALDGNPVPHPGSVDVLELGTAERIDAVVTMNNPGVWILGATKDEDRRRGMGIVIEYANKRGTPRWITPPKTAWDYTLFGESRQTSKPDEVIPLVFGLATGSMHGFEQWTINGQTYDAKAQPRKLSRGKRYRLIFDNQTEDIHPVHLHRDSFELTKVYGTRTSGVIKDVVTVKAYQKIEVDLTPSVEGLSLFHCHQQLHMDHGFKMLFDVK